ncbi:MAG: hypothetical protein DRJ03_04730 [Chloroflexi bacterium]|nr:MAG: hypothetical protein DRJ03_04730 [Chloroflexota bacterium]
MILNDFCPNVNEKIEELEEDKFQLEQELQNTNNRHGDIRAKLTRYATALHSIIGKLDTIKRYPRSTDENLDRLASYIRNTLDNGVYAYPECSEKERNLQGRGLI